VGFGAAKVKR
jgi:hypothetical protein